MSERRATGSVEPGSSGSERWLVVGLGNPGPKYERTRHNAGFLVVDELVRRDGGRLKAHKARTADVLETRLGTPPGPVVPVVLAEPRSFMNTSGGPVATLCDYYKVPAERLVVIHDELDIGFATVRVKRGGGDNGHNGLRSIRHSLGTGDFLRVRFGIGRPPGRMDPASYVLKDFGAAERSDLGWAVDRTADAVETLVREGLAAAQNAFHAADPSG